MNDFKEDPMLDSANSTRRGLLGFAGKGVLSVAAIGILGNNAAMAMAKGKMGSHNGDVDILNVALGLENEAIGAYTLGAGTGLLKDLALKFAITCQDDHKVHRDALVSAIRKLGG